MTATVQLCVTFLAGSLVVLSASFKRPPTQQEIDDDTAEDADDWQPVDPDTVTAKLMDPAAVVTVHDYLSSPGADIVRDDVGEYHLDLTPTVAGLWTFGFYSTGVGQAAAEGTFRVAASAFP
jgi:hypothetical protein